MRTGWLIPLSLVGGLLLVPSTSAIPFDEDAAYEIEDRQGRVLVNPVKLAMPKADCPSNWTRLSSGISSTHVQDHVVSIRLDDSQGWLDLVEKAPRGRVHFSYGCEGLETEQVPPKRGWRAQQATHQETPSDPVLPGPLGAGGPCKGIPTLARQRLAPFVTETTAYTADLIDPESVCLEARGAAELADPPAVPFSGTVTATLTDGEDRALKSTTCMIVVGTCWSQGQTSVDLDTDDRYTNDRWKLTCEVEALLDSPIPPVGTFSCRAWLD